MELAFEQVKKQFDSYTLQVSGTFVPGVHLVSGRVGAGKSTFAAMAAGLLLPDEGKVERRGVQASMLSMQFPEWHLTGTTIGEEIRSWGMDAAAVLKQAGFTGRGDDDPLALSRGELKKLHLACIFGRAWDLLILDEPFSALDCREKREVCRWIENQPPGILIICTHESQVLPRVDFIWEIREQDMTCVGKVPGALPGWELAPPILRSLISGGVIPDNITEADIQEAACRIRD